MSAWDKFQNDFDAMTDAQIEYESKRSQEQLEEAEDWLEAVAAWREAGSPRRAGRDDDEGYVAFCNSHGVRP